MAKLSVNINKIATLRNARGENNPDVLKMALLIESLGADGITVHPRPDQRHIRNDDIYNLKNHLKVELNIEGYPTADFISLCNDIKPAQITLVPDPPDVITSNDGFKLIDDDDFDLVKNAIKALTPSGARVSIFIDPIDFLSGNGEIIKATGTDRIELYTQAYARDYRNADILARYQSLAARVHKLGLGVNAGHDLSLDNLSPFLKALPEINEVSIGHALICDALILGMAETIKRYKAACI